MLTKTPRTLDSRFGSRNARIMRARLDQWRDNYIAMFEVNDDWHARMWQTPDIAMCLYSHYAGIIETVCANN